MLPQQTAKMKQNSIALLSPILHRMVSSGEYAVIKDGKNALDFTSLFQDVIRVAADADKRGCDEIIHPLATFICLAFNDLMTSSGLDPEMMAEYEGGGGLN